MPASKLDMTIDGKACGTSARLDVINPANGQVFASVPDASDNELTAAVSAETNIGQFRIQYLGFNRRQRGQSGNFKYWEC